MFQRRSWANALRMGDAVLVFCLGSLLPTLAFGQDRVDYRKDIQPILREKCYSCHGGLAQKAKLRVDTVSLMKQGGKHGPALIPGSPEKSLLIERLTATDPEERMPPESPPLTSTQIDKIRLWIAQGAKGPSDEKAEADPRDHWAFRTPIRPKVPGVADPNWAKNPIDAFIAAEHAKRNLKPRPPAEPAILLRRVYLDLIGLPPTSAELQAFLADSRPNKYEVVVDRLLADPRYGERWGRHWMDVWRYADWHGRRMVPDVWNSAPQVWRWRDWIVHSLNADLGYDQMVQDMLAADEVRPEDPTARVATGYLVRNWYALNPNDWMRSNVEHVGKAFLGLTFNCAHCHDHKYDPISHEDYFRFRAFFEPIGIRQDRIPGEADPGPFQEYNYLNLRKIVRLGTATIFDKNPTAPTYFYTGGDERNRVKEKGSIAPGLPALFGKINVRPVDLPEPAFYPGARADLREALLKEQRDAIAAGEKELAGIKIGDTAKVGRRLESAQHEVAAIHAKYAQAGKPTALAGRLSLLLDASTGRRIILNRVPELKTLAEDTTLRFVFQILKDGYFNFQFAKDAPKGLTAGFVGFKAGKISAYKVGSFTEADVGTYDPKSATQFEFTLKIQPKADRALLTLQNRSTGQVVLSEIATALNGWNPTTTPNQPICFDAHPGTIVAIDDVELRTPTGTRIVRHDFESPRYALGQDVVGAHGWTASSYCVAPASSRVAATMPTPELRSAFERERLAQSAVDALLLPKKLAEAKIATARVTLASLEARIQADHAKGRPEFALQAANAGEKERAANISQAELAVLSAELAVANALARSESDKDRAKTVDAAQKQLVPAKTQLQTANASTSNKDASYTPLSSTYPKTSTGRRKALAEWITSNENPLTARVAVNHLWMRHFHAPLVASVFDFGRNGAKPTHPELLDWLSAEFMQPTPSLAGSGTSPKAWSMKHLHRLIVTSQAYRLASGQGDATENAARDPENAFLWRRNIGRMEAEVVRDSLLYVADTLDLTRGGQELENSQALTTRRRSLYYSCQPEIDGKSELGVLFDAAEANECYRRSRTVVPQQALALTNSDFVLNASTKTTAKIWASLSAEQQKDSRAFVLSAFESVLSRRPSEAELKTCVEFLRESTPETRESLIRVLFNHNDFVAIR